jgi:hypothetical protein
VDGGGGQGIRSEIRMAAARDKKGENSNLLHERFLKLGAPLTVVLLYFAHRVGTYI